jgi:hypothetical protein
MAYKKYAYYNKGNKIALIEKADSTSSGFLAVAHCTLGGYTTKDTCEAAGGQWIPGSGGSIETVGEYKSPASTVAKGLEIEYTYAPTYHNASNDRLQTNKFYINGWTVVGGYLCFLRSHETGVANWDASPYTAAGDDEYILVEGSERWNGIHKIKSTGSNGILETYTKVSGNFIKATGSSNITIASVSDNKALISAANGSNIWLNAQFSAGDYIYLGNGGSSTNNGFWEISSVAADAGTESDSGIYITNKYFCHTGENTLSTEGIDTTITTSGQSSTSAAIYKVERDFCTIKTDITAMEDETFELDLTRYQANAVILYMRAKLAEEMGNIELYEYYTAKFTKQLEKASGSRKYGPHIVQGHGMTRK